MPSWPELLSELEKLQPPEAAGAWLINALKEWSAKLSAKRENRNVIVYASGFLQKPHAPPFALQVSHEDINAFMSVMHGLKWERNLTLVLHTPGGVTNATETIVEYLLRKFQDIEVIVPTYAMSAGTMISLAANRIFMGRQSQLGPIDPQMPIGGRFVSARAIVDQFNKAKDEIAADMKAAAVWAPILQHLGPALLKEAQDAIEYGETMVAKWLETRHFAEHRNPKGKAAEVASYFSRAETHKSHGRRIDRDEARTQELTILDIENDQELQEMVLTIYHLVTLVFEKSQSGKFLINQDGALWNKNVG